MHLVEQLIAERAQKLMGRQRLFKAVRPLLYRMLAYDAAVFLADAIVDKTGYEAFKLITQHINPRTAVTGLHNLPSKGRVIVMANHPTGLADGMAVFQAMRDRRPDLTFMANSDALRAIPKGQDIIIPVEWREEARTVAKTRETLAITKAALKKERCVVIFPSGRLAYLGVKGFTERPWQTSAAMLARKYSAPIVPLHIEARNSWLYYILATLNKELRDITLFHELLNKKGQLFRLTFGEPVDPASLPKNADEATAIIRKTVLSL